MCFSYLVFLLAIHLGAGKHCKPPHPFNSHIVLHQYEAGKAGIQDRTWIFFKLGNLGATLGARLVITPPFTLLSAMHNNGKEVDEWSHWWDYFHAVYNDESQMVLDSRYFNGHGVSFNYNVLKVYKPGYPVNGSFYHIAHSHLHNNTISIDGNVFSGYRAALELFRHGVPFLWHIHGNYYDYAHALDRLVAELAPEHDPECSYGTIGASKKIVEGAGQFLVKHKLHEDCFIALHLRRGDIVGTHEECNNSIPVVQEHVQCALRHLNETRMPLIIFTNGDNQYVDGVIAAIKVVYDADVFHGDRTFASFAADNFLVFSMTHRVRSMSFTTLALNRASCVPCPPPVTKVFNSAACQRK